MKKYILPVFVFMVVCITSWAFSSSMQAPTQKLTSSCPQELAGQWEGIYFYKDKSSSHIPTQFTLFVDSVSDNHFSGHIVEPRTNWGPEYLKEFQASFEGNCEGSSINFVKTYLFPNGHSINYSGKLANSKIHGQWTVGSDWGGTWKASKL